MKRRYFYIFGILALFFCLSCIDRKQAMAQESDFVIEDGVLLKYTGSSNTVVIPDSVKEIGVSAFHSTNIVTVTMGNSVEVISEYAFRNCRKLKNVRLSNSLKEIKMFAFSQCASLTNITLPVSIKKIGINTFQESKKLQYVTLSPEVSPEIFYMEITKYVTECKNGTIIYTIKHPDAAFSGQTYRHGPVCELKLCADRLVLAPGATYELRMNSKAKCDKWYSSDPSVVDVNYYGKLTARKSGSAVITAELYGEKFQCHVTVKDGVVSDQPKKEPFPEFFVVDGTLFHYYGTKSDVVIPDGVTEIGAFAFSYINTRITSVILPDSVTVIGKLAFEGRGMQEIQLPKNLARIEQSAFFYCNKLKTIEIPDSVTDIGESAFSCCDKLESVILPNRLVKMQNDLFYGCRNLMSITVPESVETIEGAFATGKPLQSIILSENIRYFDILEMDVVPNTILEQTTIYVPDKEADTYVVRKAGDCGIKVETLSLKEDRVTLSIGDTYELSMLGNAACDSWGSDNPLAATVSQSGQVKAVGKGTAIITAELYGKKCQCTVEVE